MLLFKLAVEEYMKARPREWLALNGFRANRIEADQGWTEYLVIIQHRESWQNIGYVLDSKANLSSYCQEVLKQLGIHYKAPPLPVDLRCDPSQTIPGFLSQYEPHRQQESSLPSAKETGSSSVVSADANDGYDARAAFRDMAVNRHNIFLG